MNEWQKEALRFREDCGRAAELSRENLRKLMEDNRDTVYGRRYGFASIRDAGDYRRRVPISDYSDYEDGILRMRQGERRVLTAYEVKHYIMSSGSTGRPKRIPLTTEALTRCIPSIYYTAFACVPGIADGRYLHMSVFRMDLSEEERDTILSAAYFRELHDRGTFGLEERYVGGEQLMFSREIGNVPYVKLWLALSYPELAGIQAFFLYDILLFLRYFENHWEAVLKDVEQRKIPADLPLSESVKKALLQLPLPGDVWLRKVRTECGRGFERIVERLWGQMRSVSGVGGSTFSAQEPMLRFYLGRIPVHYFTYAASEGMMAVAAGMETTRNILIPHSGFYEFLPYEKEGDGRPRGIEELEIGEYYEHLVTNFSGFYRYRLNDVVKVTGFYGQAPVMEICFRKNQAVNIAGEKMDLQTVAKAVELLAQRCGIRICEYSIHDDKRLLPGRYQCFLELDGREKLPGREAGKHFDRLLMELNEDYQDLRGLGLIGEPVVSQVRPGAHLECKQHFTEGPVNNKPLQYLADPAVIRFMKERII